MALVAYRFFSNTCREAMTRYQEVFGGRLDLMTFADMPPGEDEGPDDIDPDLIMHAALVLDGEELMLMASDDPTGDGDRARGVALHHTAGSIEDAERIFDALAEGGTIEMPFEEVFWAKRFGSVVDRFGTSWMISVDH